MKLWLTLGFALLWASSAHSQNAVTQNGTVVPRDVAQWARDRTIQDPGGLTGRTADGLGLNPFSITDNGGFGLCFNNATTLGPYNSLCLGHDSDGNAHLSINGNPADSFRFDINGVPIPFPGTLTGLPTVIDNNTLKASPTTIGTMVLRQDFSLGFGASPLFYKASASACSLNGGLGDDGSQVKSSDNKCWIAQFPASGIDVRAFGADPTCTNDAAPAWRKVAAITSGKKIIANGCYLFGSTTASGLPAINPANVRFTGQNDFALDLRNAEFRTTDAASYSGMIQIDSAKRFQVLGGNFVGNHAGYAVGAEACGIVPYNVTEFSFVGQTFTGNFGGNGTAFCGDFQVNGAYRDITMYNVGQCFDFAFIRNVTFDNFHAAGVGANGSTGKGNKCFSIIYDVPALGNNTTGITIGNTSGVSVTNSSAEKFGFGWYLESGDHITFSNNNWSGQTGDVPGTDIAAGGYIVYDAVRSVGRPPSSVTINGDRYMNNGGGGISGYGILINLNAISGTTDKIKNLIINDALFATNGNAGIEMTPIGKIGNFGHVKLNLLCDGTPDLTNFCIGTNMASLKGDTGPGTTVSAFSNMPGARIDYADGFVMGNAVSYQAVGNATVAGGNPVTVSSGAANCGTSPSINGNNVVGAVTVGSGANGNQCTVNFSANWPSNPGCIATSNQSARTVRVLSSTQTAIIIAGNTTLSPGDILTYICLGQR